MTELCKTRDTWITPQDFRDAVVEVFGSPELDVAADGTNAFTDDPVFFYDGKSEGDGLWREWDTYDNHYAWCNPPGSAVSLWTAKALKEAILGNRSLVLVQAGISSKWYQAVRPYCETLLLTPRIQFDPPAGIPKSSKSRDYMLLVFEPWMTRIPGDRVRTWKWKTIKGETDE